MPIRQKCKYYSEKVPVKLEDGRMCVLLKKFFPGFPVAGSKDFPRYSWYLFL